MGLLDETVVDEFLNTPGEVHPVWFGFCEAIGIGAQVPLLAEEEVRNLIHEMHYCLLGFAAAGVVLAGLVAIGVGIPVGLVFGSGVGTLAGVAAAATYLLYWTRSVAPDISAGFRDDIVAAVAEYDRRRAAQE